MGSNQRMSLTDYTPLSDEDKPIIEKIELHSKEIELLVLKYAKDETLKKHALIRLFEAGIMAKESIKKDSVFGNE
jgi:hypothetical protein